MTNTKVFFPRDSKLKDHEPTLEQLVSAGMDGYELVVPCLGPNHLSGRVWEDNVKPWILGADRVIALFDSPNINVGFELGFSLAVGKPTVIATLHPERADWVKKILPGQIIPRARDVEELRELIRNARERPEAPRPTAGDRTFFLCSSLGKGVSFREIHREKLATGWEDWNPNAKSLDEHLNQLGGIGRVVWVITKHDPRATSVSTDEEAIENAFCAILAGYARGLGLALEILIHEPTEEIADVEEDARRFPTNEKLEGLLEELRGPIVGGDPILTGDPGGAGAVHESEPAHPDLGPRFRFIQRMGGGAMSEIFLALDLLLDKQLVIKRALPLPPGGSGPRPADKVAHEGKILRELKHANIVTFYDMHEHGGVPMIAMELLEGPSLAELAARRERQDHDRLTPAEAWILIEQLAPALDHMRQLGISHGDIKPDNLVLEAEVRSGRLDDAGEAPLVKLIDFGLATAANVGLMSSADMKPAGTPAFVAPEVLREKAPSPSADLYSFAATLYTLVKGQLPCGVSPDAGDKVVLKAMLEGPTVPLDSGDPGLDRAIAAGLEQEPRLRPALAAELLSFRKGQPEAEPTGRAALEPEPVQRKERRRRSPRRRLLEAVGATLGALALIVFGIQYFGTSKVELFSEVEAKLDEAGFPNRATDRKTGITFARIQAGSFTMGSQAGEGALDEHPSHNVDFERTFYASTLVVTVGQWRRFVDETGYVTTAERNAPPGFTFDAQGVRVRLESASWSDPLPRHMDEVGDEYPVTQVSWHDARAYCEHYGYRLPTEEEWEYMCRGTTTYRYWWGDDPLAAEGKGNFAGIERAEANQLGRPPGITFGHRDPYVWLAPAAVGDPNTLFSLRGTLGNVLEWCADSYDSKGYQAKKEGREAAPKVPTQRVQRGGSFRSGPNAARCAARFFADENESSCEVGFRVVIDTDQVEFIESSR